MQTCNFFSVGNRTYILSYSHFQKLHVCTLFFLYLVCGSKIREIDHIVIPSDVVSLRPYPPQFLKNGHVPPHPFHTMIQQRQSFFAASAHILSRSLYRSHVLNTFFGLVLGAMMKQVCWHSKRSEAHRGLPEARPRTQNVMARGQSEAHGDSNLYNTRQD